MSPLDTQKDLAAGVVRMMEQHGIRHHEPSRLDYYTGYEDLYDWELYLDTLALAHLGCDRYAANGLRIFLHAQRENGLIPRHIARAPLPPGQPDPNAWAALEAEEPAKPFLAQTALLIARQRGELSWLTFFELETIARFVDHWLTQYDLDGSGLAVWQSAPHAGADTQFSRLGPWRSGYAAGVDLNCMLYVECMALAQLAHSLGRPLLLARYESEALRLEAAVQTLWDEQDGMFYDRDVRSGEPIRVKAASTFFPLWAGIATKEQARRLVEEHLRNPAEFATPFPIPSYARSEPEYTQVYDPPAEADPMAYLERGHANWCGGMWPHWNYLIAHGLARYGYGGDARRIAEAGFAVAEREPFLYEWYNAETGAGQGMHPFWAGASVLLVFLPAELAAGVDPTVVQGVNEALGLARVRRALDLTEPFRPLPHPPTRVIG